MEMKVLMDAVVRALYQLPEQACEKDIESITIERDSPKGGSKLFVDFKNDMRAIYRFSDEKMEYVHEKTIDLFQ